MAKAKPIRHIRPKAPLVVSAKRIIESRLDEMLTFETFVYDPEAVRELHQLRIAAKRLRYTLELFQEGYDAFSGCGQAIRDATKWAEQIQESLGAMHDADVLVPQLTEHLADIIKSGYGKDDHGEPVVGTHHVDYEGCLGLIAVCRQLSAERDRRYAQFVEEWQRLQEQEAFDVLRARLHEAANAVPTEQPDLPNRNGEAVEPVTGPRSDVRREKPQRQRRRRQPTVKPALR